MTTNTSVPNFAVRVISEILQFLYGYVIVYCKLKVI